MEYEWDEEKRRKNKRKHGIDFSDIVHFDLEYAFETDVALSENGEIRTRLIGPLKNDICVLVYTMRNNKVRVISLRNATRKEANLYVRYIE